MVTGRLQQEGIVHCQCTTDEQQEINTQESKKPTMQLKYNATTTNNTNDNNDHKLILDHLVFGYDSIKAVIISC